MPDVRQQGIDLVMRRLFKTSVEENLRDLPIPEQLNQRDVVPAEGQPKGTQVQLGDVPVQPPPPPPPPIDDDFLRPTLPPPPTFRPPLRRGTRTVPVDKTEFVADYFAQRGWKPLHRGTATTEELRADIPKLAEANKAYSEFYGVGEELASAGRQVGRLLPVVGTIIDWERMTPLERGISIAVDTAILAIPAFRGAKAGADQTLKVALKKGLDKWVFQQSGRPQRYQSELYQLLEQVLGKDKSGWLARKATESLTNRKGNTARVVDDVVKEVRTLLLDNKGKLRPVADIMRDIEGTAPRAKVPVLAELKPKRLITTEEKHGGFEAIITSDKGVGVPVGGLQTTAEGARASATKILTENLSFLEKEWADTGVAHTFRNAVKELAPTPKGVVPEEPTALMVVGATNEQKVLAHNIARTKGLIGRDNKSTQEYKDVAKRVTGKSSMKDMTQDEADDFTQVLENFIPKFGQPTALSNLFTSMNYYAEILGLKPLVRPAEIGKQKLDLENTKTHIEIERKLKELNTAFGTSRGEKIKAPIKNIPTKAEEEMATLLNTYEELPAVVVGQLTPELAASFRWFRDLSKLILERENKVRVALGMDEIPHRQAYLRHLPSQAADAIIKGEMEVPPQLTYWSKKVVSEKIWNPSEIQRLETALADLYSKDLRAVTRAMITTGLREVHLSEPLHYFKQQMGLYEKRMPASTRRWVEDYVNQQIKGQETELDASINRIVTTTGIGGLFDKVLAPFGRSVGRKPVTKMAQAIGKGTILSVMTPRPGLPKMLIRNLFQHTQNLAIHGVKATAMGELPATGELKVLMNESIFLKGYTGVEELPADLGGKIERFLLKAYGTTAIWNARRAMKTAYWATKPYITNPRYKGMVGKEGQTWFDPKRTGNEPLYPSEKAKILEEMEFSAAATQYSYIPMGMPGIFKHKTLAPITRLQSWWMNYFAKFGREALYRAFSGHTRQGLPLPRIARTNWLKYLIIGGGVLTAMGYNRAFLWNVLPYNLAPVGQFALGAWIYATAPDNRARGKGKTMMKNSWNAFVPGLLGKKEVEQLWTGERQPEDFFFYDVPEKGLPPRIPDYNIPSLGGEPKSDARKRYEELKKEFEKKQDKPKTGQTARERYDELNRR